jgi:hypothetical protein
MNNWYGAERLAADRRADLAREAHGDSRLRAASEQEHDLQAGRSTTRAIVLDRFHAAGLFGRARTMLRAIRARSSAT